MVLESVLKTFASRFSASLVSYFHLWTYLDERLVAALEGRPTRTYTSCRAFYSAVYGGELRHGDRVRLENCFVTDWIPRLPGGYSHPAFGKWFPWVNYDDISRGAWDSGVLLLDKSDLMPCGSVRLPAPVPGGRAGLGAVFVDEWSTDLGIVLNVNASVYFSFKSRQHKNNAVEATVEGILDLGDAETAPGMSDNLPHEVACVLAGFPTPVIRLRVESPLQTTFRWHDSHPLVTTWAIRRIQFVPGHRLVLLNFRDENRAFSRPINDVEYEFRAYTMLENNWGELDECIRALRIAPTSLVGESDKYLPERWADDPKVAEVEYVAGFDGTSRRLRTSVPLSSDPRRDVSVAKRMAQRILEASALESEDAEKR